MLMSEWQRGFFAGIWLAVLVVVLAAVIVDVLLFAPWGNPWNVTTGGGLTCPLQFGEGGERGTDADER